MDEQLGLFREIKKLKFFKNEQKKILSFERS